LETITNVNTATYDSLALSKTERRYVTTTDGKKMLVWVILPPNFDATKKYNTLYCQGGQKRLTQFYSFRWNFQVNGC
jgi:dipeptidyl aminopeptidase/acylaminoacyl peptidase